MSPTLLLWSLVLAVAYGSLNPAQSVTVPQSHQVLRGIEFTVQVLPAPSPHKNTYAELISDHINVQTARDEALTARLRTPKPQIICGMKLWRVDPNVDRGIHIQLPEAAFDARIERIPPATCRE